MNHIPEQTSEIRDFVGVFDNYFSDLFCDKIIKFYNEKSKFGFSYPRRPEEINSMRRKDRSVNLAPVEEHELEQYLKETREYVDTDQIFNHDLTAHFNTIFWNEIYQEYIKNYEIINTLGQHTFKFYKIQKTEKSEGFHEWHVDGGRVYDRARFLTYILYLNDVDEGGETEFLYQSRRIKPKKGRLILFPCAFTHPHRGNPPLSGTKYILTGWAESIE